jgi:hypothetical protein
LNQSTPKALKNCIGSLAAYATKTRMRATTSA